MRPAKHRWLADEVLCSCLGDDSMCTAFLPCDIFAKQGARFLVPGGVMRLPPNKGVREMRHVFQLSNPKAEGMGIGPTGEPMLVATVRESKGGGDTVITTVSGGPGPGTTVSDGGGRKMTSARLYVIFWGDGWKSISPASPSMDDVLNDIAAVVASPYLEGLGEYTSFTKATLEAAYFVDGYNPPGNFSYVDTDYIAWYNMAYGPIPETLETIVCVMMPPGITNPSLNGFHHFSIAPNLTTVPVLWVLYRNRAGISCTFSHELVETITDPDGTGIQINPTSIINWNEIGDACNNLCQPVNGVTVQSYWSNTYGACIIPKFVPVIERQITCIRKHEHGDINHPIRWVSGLDVPSSQAFQMTKWIASLQLIKANASSSRVRMVREQMFVCSCIFLPGVPKEFVTSRPSPIVPGLTTYSRCQTVREARSIDYFPTGDRNRD